MSPLRDSLLWPKSFSALTRWAIELRRSAAGWVRYHSVFLVICGWSNVSAWSEAPLEGD
jgi:hypothetical protein